MFNRNSIPALCSDIMAASLPFITIGLLGNSTILYISMTIGVIGLIGLGISILLKDKIESYKLEKVQLQDFSFSYAIALSAAILNTYGIEASIGYWCALGLGLIVICRAFIPNKNSK